MTKRGEDSDGDRGKGMFARIALAVTAEPLIWLAVVIIAVIIVAALTSRVDDGAIACLLPLPLGFATICAFEALAVLIAGAIFWLAIGFGAVAIIAVMAAALMM